MADWNFKCNIVIQYYENTTLFPQMETEEQEAQTLSLDRGDSTLRTKFYDAIILRLKDLMGDRSGLDGLSRFSMEVDLTDKRQPELMEFRAILQKAQAKYDVVLKLLEPKVYKEMTRRQFEEAVVKSITASFSSNLREATRQAYAKYREIVYSLRAMGAVDIDGIVVAAWYGIAEALSDGFKAGYRILQLCMEDICDLYGRKRFPISYEEYRSTFMQLHYEITAGDKSAAIVEKIMTQLMVYATYNDVGLEYDLGGFTLRQIFDSGAKTLCFGYLMDNGKPEFSSLWQHFQSEFDRMVSRCREPLFRTFYEEVVTYQKPRITYGKLDSDYSYAFQAMENSEWATGELYGKIELQPMKFEFMPRGKYAAISSVLGAPGSNKSTTLGALSELLITKGRGFDFIVLSDNSNWPTYAFMPQLPIPKNGTYKFNAKLGVAPKAIPTLILNVVRDLSEIEARGEVLTKYDRIIKVKSYQSFRIEFSSILEELGRISEEFGYSGTIGMIAVRNMMRRGTATDKAGKRYDTEIRNAVSMLDSFNDWRRNHTKQPGSLTIDEVREAQLGQARSREGSQLADLIETGIISARRHNYAMKFAGHIASDLSERARAFTSNTFWKNLPVERSKTKSSLDVLLDSLPLEYPEQADAVRRLYHSSAFAKTRLMFYHSRQTNMIKVVQTMPATFQPQVGEKDPIDIYNFYLKMNPSISRETFFRKKNDLKYDFIATSADPESRSDGEEDTESEETGDEDIEEAFA